MASTRLPGKPLLDIAGLPMIVHVLRRAEEANIGRVAVATDTPEIAAAVAGPWRRGRDDAAPTTPPARTGSLRRFASSIRNGDAEIVINLQGDFPTIAPDNIRDVLPPLDDPAVDIATLAAEIRDEEEHTTPSVVKLVGSALRQPKDPRPVFHPRHRALRRWPALPSHRPLRLPAGGAGALRQAAAIGSGNARKARAAPRAGSRHAHRRHHRRYRAARRRHGRRPRNRPSHTGEKVSD